MSGKVSSPVLTTLPSYSGGLGIPLGDGVFATCFDIGTDNLADTRQMEGRLMKGTF